MRTNQCPHPAQMIDKPFGKGFALGAWAGSGTASIPTTLRDEREFWSKRRGTVVEYLPTGPRKALQLLVALPVIRFIHP